MIAVSVAAIQTACEKLAAKNVPLQDLVPSAFSFRIKVSAIFFKVNEINNQPSLAATLGQ